MGCNRKQLAKVHSELRAKEKSSLAGLEKALMESDNEPETEVVVTDHSKDKVLESGMEDASGVTEQGGQKEKQTQLAIQFGSVSVNMLNRRIIMTIVLGKFTKDENDLFDIMDDWLRRDCIIFVGWSGLLLFPCAYFALAGWFTGTTFVTSWYTHGLASSYLEGCNFLTAAVSTPANSLAHLLLLWGPEAEGDFTHWCQLGGLWTFVALHGAFGLIGFGLHQFELARSVQLRPYNAIAFSDPIVVFVSVFLIYPLGQSCWFFVPALA
ncbi:uncharacterized protein LOC114256778 [Camellia sinensis]|uniref:uncharacterized protein LOC114256778 n=1 Tax=Camellia sinensis TaxID=4442 RepID=UPI001036A891|nr:uncharacterized protein LOC114256778 [Camellia sinensis]